MEKKPLLLILSNDTVENQLVCKQLILERFPNCDIAISQLEEDAFELAFGMDVSAIMIADREIETTALDLILALKDNSRTKGIPILMVCERQVSREQKRKALLAGVFDIVVYPIGLEELTKKIKEMLDIEIHFRNRMTQESQAVKANMNYRKSSRYLNDLEYVISENGLGFVLLCNIPEMTILHVSDSVCAFLGYNPEEMTGRPCSDFLLTESCQTFPPFIGHKDPQEIEFPNESQTGTLQWRFVRKDGKKLDTLVTTKIDINQDGDWPRFLGIVRPRFESELPTRQSYPQLECWQIIAENAPIFIFGFDVNDKLFIWNKKCQEAFGWSMEELNEHEDILFLLFPDLEYQQELKNSMYDNSPPVFREWHPLTREGNPLSTHWANFHLSDGTLIGLGYDISNHKKVREQIRVLENQLQQAQKMEAIGHLTGGIAHDFNNLLTSITGNIALIQMDLDPDSDLSEPLEEIEQAARRAAELTGQLLAFSRKQIVVPKVIDLNELLANMHKTMLRTIGEDIDVRIFRKNEHCRIKADPVQIEQIIINLVLNARDAMPAGGKLSIETADLFLDRDFCRSHPDLSEGPYVMLVISDSGIGMDKETIKHIFDPLFTTKDVGHGTGFGLSTVYGIVKQHKGHIDVRSEPGKGTTFVVYFQQARDQAESLSRVALLDDLPRGSETVLVVEDDAMVRSISMKILERQGYKVLGAENGSTSLAMAMRHKFQIDLLLTDIIMPGMNGRELAVELLRSYPKLKILYTSGYSKKVVDHYGILEKDNEFISKPYTPRALAMKVRQVLDEH